MPKTAQTVQRTAKSEFKLAGENVPKGQVVTLDMAQLDKLAAAGCVEADPVKDGQLPTLDDLREQMLASVSPAVVSLTDPEQARIAIARQASDAEIAEIDRRNQVRKSEIGKELQQIEAEGRKAIDAANEKSTADLQTIADQVTKARTDADAKIAAIGTEITKARDDANKAIAAINAEVEAAKAAGTSGSSK